MGFEECTAHRGQGQEKLGRGHQLQAQEGLMCGGSDAWYLAGNRWRCAFEGELKAEAGNRLERLGGQWRHDRQPGWFSSVFPVFSGLPVTRLSVQVKWVSWVG